MCLVSSSSQYVKSEDDMVIQGEATMVASQQGAATAVALAAADGQPTAYFVGHNAALKIHTLSTGAQVDTMPEHNAWQNPTA